MAKYWFERGLVNGRVGRAVYPTGWQGRAVIALFVLAMVGGGSAFLLIALLTPHFALGIVAFICGAVAGPGIFLWAAATKSDPTPRPERKRS